VTELNAVRPRDRDREWRWGLGAASLLVVALIWQGLALQLHSLLLPTFTSTVAAGVHLAGNRELWAALWISNQAAALGFICAALVGITLGLAMGWWRLVEKMFDPYLHILLAVPKAALIPVLVMATGLGLLSRVLVVFSFSVVSITVNTRAGVRLVEGSWLEMAHSFGASEAQLWRKVVLPGALPGIVAGLRLGLVRSVSGMITVELLLLALGVGRLILTYRETFQAADLYATTLFVVAEAVVLMHALDWVERRAFAHIGEAVGE
jgi:ABC-type nitrate/sulfonate/bicarbonate transport system permease component